MKTEIVSSDGLVYHLTTKNETRPVLVPTTMKNGFSRRFRGRIELRANGLTTWSNDHKEVGLQGFRSVRITYCEQHGTAIVQSS